MVLKKVNQSSEKIIGGGKDKLKTTPKEHQKKKTRSHDKTTIFFTIQMIMFGFLLIAAINRRGCFRRLNCSKGMWMVLSAFFVLTRMST